jgi:PadR family transcriptional regulator
MPLPEFHQFILLALLRLGNDASTIELRTALGDILGRLPGRGSLYRALDRLEADDRVAARLEDATPDRGGSPARRFRVTPAGIAALVESRATLRAMWSGLEDVLG